MITRRKSLIIVSGKNQFKVMPILANHEGLVEIKNPSEIPNIWHHNKTPIIRMRSFQKLSPSYAGDVIVFNTDELLPSLEQNVVTDVITKFCYGFKIEPGEFKVKNTANNSSDGCLFCEITKHPGMSTYEHNLKCKTVDMIIYESEHFVVVPGLGPLAPGYLMIMTKDHYLSLAQIPVSWLPEYYTVEEDVADILTKMYHLPVAFYEHGTGPNGAVGLKTIVHMHIHVMLDAPLKEDYKKMFCMEKIRSITSLRPISYFTYKLSSHGDLWATTDPDVYLQRQVHRQIYAEEHNLAFGQFNWRKVAFEDQTETNVWQLYSYLSSPDNVAPGTGRYESCEAFIKAGKERFKTF